MARAKRKRNRSNLKLALDATPERLTKGDDSDFVNPAEIDSFEQPIGRVRRFKASHLDRLYSRQKLTWAQWYAGDWYRKQHYRAYSPVRVVSSYGERTTGGDISYGLPRSEAQLRARKLVKDARDRFPIQRQSFMDKFLIHDDLPIYSRRVSLRTINEIQASLDRLAGWLLVGA